MSAGVIILIVCAMLVVWNSKYQARYKKSYWGTIKVADPDNIAKGRIRGGRVLAVIGACFLVLSLVVSLNRWHFVRLAVRAPGTILGMRQERNKVGVSYFPTFAFKDDKGFQHTNFSDASESPPEFQVGDKVSVLYLHDDPQTAHIDSFWQMWGTPISSALGGLIALALGLILVKMGHGLLDFFRGKSQI